MERGDSISMPTSNMNSSPSATLGLDMHLNSQNLSFHHGQAVSMRHHPSSSPFSPYPAIPRTRQPQPANLDSDEPDVVSKRPLPTSQQGQNQQQQSGCPWARMKWTEGMVRLLISEVYRAADDGAGTEQADHHGGKGANRAGGPAKGKWKGVSRAMIDKGFYVSPQQCEDKFNDLNKRYKRVIDLLGKGTACRVVENPTLLDSMDITPKAKEEARKLLNSKHLFFPEMCAYHNAGGGCVSPGTALPSPPSHMNNISLMDQQQCMHHQPGSSQTRRINHHAHASHHSDDEDEEEDNTSDNESNGSSEKEGEYDTDDYEGGATKKQRTIKHSVNSPPLSLSLSSTSGGNTAVQQLKSELMGVISTGAEGAKQWMKRRMAELEEQRVGHQRRAYQLEKQRFKWLRYSSNKEREMERMRLQNDRLRLENERMLLLLRQKEMEQNFGASFVHRQQL